MNVLSAKVKQERRHLKGVVRLAKRGVISKEDADASFEGWVAHVKKGDSFKLIRRMRRYYRDLWKGEIPMVVIKRTNGDIEGSRREENIVAALDTYNANITYLSCMCGVDLPENEEVTGYEHAGIED